MFSLTFVFNQDSSCLYKISFAFITVFDKINLIQMYQIKKLTLMLFKTNE